MILCQFFFLFFLDFLKRIERDATLCMLLLLLVPPLDGIELLNSKDVYLYPFLLFSFFFLHVVLLLDAFQQLRGTSLGGLDSFTETIAAATSAERLLQQPEAMRRGWRRADDDSRKLFNIRSVVDIVKLYKN